MNHSTLYQDRPAPADTLPCFETHTETRTERELRVLIVDRDPNARAGLHHLCRANGLQTLATADTGTVALQLARRLEPDLVFVDVDLADMTGLELLEELKEDAIGGVLVTACTESALRAYEAGVVDYVTKPVCARRFVQAISRARLWLAGSAARRGEGDTDRYIRASDAALNSNGPQSQLLVGERHHRLYVLDPARIDYVEAKGNYVMFHGGSHEYLSRDTLKRLEGILQMYGFLRIENSLLLKLGAIDYAVPIGRGRFAFTLHSGMSLRSSLTYRARILERLPLVRGGATETISQVLDLHRGS
jgi:two-component system LytT family response regulator